MLVDKHYFREKGTFHCIERFDVLVYDLKHFEYFGWSLVDTFTRFNACFLYEKGDGSRAYCQILIYFELVLLCLK